MANDKANKLADYEPCGDEWVKFVMRMSKADITEMFRKTVLEKIALADENEAATELIGEIMRGEVNAEDECEKYLREYNPRELLRSTS